MSDKKMFSYCCIFRTKKILFEFLGVLNPPLVIVNIFMIFCRLKVFKSFESFKIVTRKTLYQIIIRILL